MPLTAKEYALLEYLARRAGDVVSRADIAEHVWDEHYDPLSNVVDVYVQRLRRKLDRAGIAVADSHAPRRRLPAGRRTADPVMTRSRSARVSRSGTPLALLVVLRLFAADVLWQQGSGSACAASIASSTVCVTRSANVVREELAEMGDARDRRGGSVGITGDRAGRSRSSTRAAACWRRAGAGCGGSPPCRGDEWTDDRRPAVAPARAPYACDAMSCRPPAHAGDVHASSTQAIEAMIVGFPIVLLLAGAGGSGSPIGLRPVTDMAQRAARDR